MKLLKKLLLILTLSCGFTIIYNIQNASALDWSNVQICVTGGPVKTGYTEEYNEWESTYWVQRYGIWTWSFPVYITGGFCGNDPQDSRCQVGMNGREIWDYWGDDMWYTEAWHKTGAVTGGTFDCSGESEHHNSPITTCYTPHDIQYVGDDNYYMKISYPSDNWQVLHGYVKIIGGEAGADEIEGRAIAGPKDTGYVQDTTSVLHKINDCPTTGCQDQLKLLLRWKTTLANEPAQYKVRILRDGTWSEWKEKPDTATRPNNSNELTVQEGTETLLPGESVCYQLEFLKYGKDGRPIYVTACAAAANTFETNLDMNVKNENIEKYNKDGLTEVYARPGNKVTFTTNYTPNPQYAYNFSYSDPKIINFTCQGAEAIEENQIIHTGTLGSSYGAKLGNCNSPGPWRNAFSIQKDAKTDFSSSGNVIENPSYKAGNMSKQTSNNSITVSAANVGTSVNEKAVTNLNSNTKTTPEKVEFSFGNEESLPENIYYIYSASYNRVLDLRYNDAQAGFIQLYDANQSDAQKWIIQKTEDGYYRITHATSGRALDVTGNYTDNGALVQLYKQNNESCAQKWEIEKNDDDTYTFKANCGTSGKVLDADATTEGKYIIIHESHGGSNQHWRIEPVTKNNVINIDTSPVDSNVTSAKIPYNFENTTCIYDNKRKENNENGCLKSNSNGIVYAGESDSVGFKIFVNPRNNKVIGSTYATPVRNAQWKLELRYDSNDYQTILQSDTDENKPLNLNDGTSYKDTGIQQDMSKNKKVDIPDVAAGTKLCFRSAIFPKDSGTDTNLNSNYYDPANPDSWSYSDEACFIVAKKPSLQVWGGNVYSNGKINTNTAEKGNLAGYKEWSMAINNEDDKTNYVFGSWGELGVISSGTITGFSSGASLGYTSNVNGTLKADPGGNTKNLCGRSLLTFANSPCSSNSVGNIGNSTFSKNANSDNGAFTNKFAYGGDPNVENTVILNDDSKIKERNIYYYYGGSKQLIVPGSEIKADTIQIVHSKEKITIANDLIYKGNYSSFNNMPKLVIYSEGDININCDVNRIDALLIAKNTVKTCADFEDPNDKKHSNQLVINGAVISGSLEPTRTYGAATGANSIIPAEIINYDPSLYLWGGEQSQDNGKVSTNMDVTYSRELAPRY